MAKLRDVYVSLGVAIGIPAPTRSEAPSWRIGEVRALSTALPLGYSLYLDFVRFLAAGAVFLEHVSSYPFSRETRASVHPLLVWLGSYGNTAVIVFFVLSGHVIAYVVATRESTGWMYTVSRLSRLYSVVLPALIVTFAMDFLGGRLNPAFYEIPLVLWKPESWWSYLSSAVFVNEFQIFHAPGTMPGTNAPFWSLSFEATYYVIGGLVLFAPLRYALPCSLILLGLAGRTITALLPLWAVGYWAFHARERMSRRLPAPVVIFAAASAAILILPLVSLFASGSNFGLYFPWGRGAFNRNLALDYAIALAFVMQLFAAYRLLHDTRIVSRSLETTVRWLGSTTFPMYAMHYPVLCFFAALTPFARPSWMNILFVSCGVVWVVVLMTPACEWLRVALRKMAGRLRHWTPAKKPVTRVQQIKLRKGS